MEARSKLNIVKTAFYLSHLHSIELQMLIRRQTPANRNSHKPQCISFDIHLYCNYITLHFTPTCRKGTYFLSGSLRSMTCTVVVSSHVSAHTIENLLVLKKILTELEFCLMSLGRIILWVYMWILVLYYGKPVVPLPFLTSDIANIHTHSWLPKIYLPTFFTLLHKN